MMGHMGFSGVSRGVIAMLLSVGTAAPVMAQAVPVAGADDESPGRTIVVTATRAPIAIDEAPVTVSVITDEQIADELATDIRDLIRYEPGVTVRRAPARFNAALSTTGRAGNEGFTIRGIGGNRVLIQVDGVRIPYGFSFGAQDVGRGDYVDIGLVKSVEILRGPSSALYGSDGLAGTVSFRTADPEDFLRDGNNIGGLARAAYSSADDEFAETAIVAGRSGAWSAMAAYTRRDWQELDNKGTNDVTGSARTTPNPQDGRSNAALGRIVWDGGSGHRVRLTGEYLDTRVFTEGLSNLSASVDLLEAVDTGERWRAALDWTWQGDGLVDFARFAAYIQDARDVQFTDEDRTPAADRERLNTFENRVWGLSGEARSEFATGALSHRLIFGADYSRTRQTGLRDGTVPPMGETFPTRAFPVTNFTQIGAFIGDEIVLGPVTLFPALRFDHYSFNPHNDAWYPGASTTSQSGERVSPKIGIVLALSDEVRLFANYGQGYKAPEPSQVNQFFENIAFGYISRPNPDLGPERSEGWEGGLRFTSDNVSLSITGFTLDFKDFITQEVVAGSFTPADPAVYQFVNLSSASVRGAEARLQLNAGNGFTGNLSISYASGNSTDPAGVVTPLATIDPLRLVAGLGWRDPGGRFGGQFIATHSARKETDRTAGLCSPACYRPDGFTLLDATAWVRFGDAITLRAGVFNIFDEKYSWWSDVRGMAMTDTDPTSRLELVRPATADAYTQPGRNASVSLSFRF